jgi:RNA polymerase sigma-70 factor (ECF subfamily)
MWARTTHASLLERLADRSDEAAWREFGDRYGALLRGFAVRRGLSGADCDDLVQEVTTALVGSMPSFRYDPAKGRFRGYLKTIAGRAIQRRIRQNQRSSPLEDLGGAASDPAAPESPEQDEAWETEWRQYHMRLAMRTIEVEFGPIDRLAFQRYAVEGRPPQATAEELGISIDRVYQAKSRIMRRLSELVAEQTADEG